MAFDIGVGFGDAGPAPVVVFPWDERVTVWRVWSDPYGPGDVIQEQVRWTTWDGGTLYVRDPEVQQGRTYSYVTQNDISAPVTIPELPQTILIHPTQPALSVEFDIIEDADRDYPLDAGVTTLPGADRAPGMATASPVVVSSGYRSSAQGSTTIRTTTIQDKRRLLALVRDGSPLFWSHHIGLDMPEWVTITDLTEKRFVQQCSHNLDDPGDVGQWRDWTLKWVEHRRPSPVELPMSSRIMDVEAPIGTVDIPIQEM